ncbi:MAG: thiamine pyrophosphate-binding protein [Gammaproteobacteria bacterium]
MPIVIPSWPEKGAPLDRSWSYEAGDLVVQYLEQLGIEFVFGIPGGAIEPLYNALARSERRGSVRCVVARHESGAAFMADGYARETNKLGVCCSTTGPGATNLITGVSCAYENEIPMLVITAQTSLPVFGRGAFQESSCTGVDTVGMFQYCTRYNTLVSHVSQLEHKLVAAVLATHCFPRGPAHLSIPLDLLRKPAGVEQPSYDLTRLLRHRSMMDENGLEMLYAEIIRARRVVVVIGGGCSEAVKSILELAVLLDALIVATPQGKGLVSSYHPQFRGVFGFAGHQSARDALIDPEVDLVLGIGSTMGEWVTGGWDEEAILNDRLIHIDATETHFSRTPMARLHVAGNIQATFNLLLQRFSSSRLPGSGNIAKERRRNPEDRHGGEVRQEVYGGPKRRSDPARRLVLDEEAKYNDCSTPVKPQWLMHELARRFPYATRFLADTGNSTAWAVHYLHHFDRRVMGQPSSGGGLFRVCMEFASMGWAIGAAVGTALGRPKTPVVCITGDGSLLMNGQEITVAVSEKLPVIFVVLNDAALGMVRHGQRFANAESIGNELPPVDFCALAKAMGADAYTIQSPANLLALDINAMCSRDGPTLLDVHVDPDEAPPMKTRMKVLGARMQ